MPDSKDKTATDAVHQESKRQKICSATSDTNDEGAKAPAATTTTASAPTADSVTTQGSTAGSVAEECPDADGPPLYNEIQAEFLCTLGEDGVGCNALTEAAALGKILGCKQTFRWPEEGDKVMHLSMSLGATTLLFADRGTETDLPNTRTAGSSKKKEDEKIEEKKEEDTKASSFSSSSSSYTRLCLPVRDPEALFERAKAAEGADVLFDLKTMFWGSKWGAIMDPAGVTWCIGGTSRKGEGQSLPPESAQLQVPSITVKKGTFGTYATFLEKGLGASKVGETYIMNGIVMHQEMELNGAKLFVYERPTEEATEIHPPLFITTITDDAKALGEAFVKEGATVTDPIEKRHWGDIWGMVRTAGGHRWAVMQELPLSSKAPTAASGAGDAAAGAAGTAAEASPTANTPLEK